MSLFRTPQEHAANPPETWTVVKVVGPTRDHWRLCAGETELHTYSRKRDAENEKHSGFYVDLYRKESRWYAGETIPHWKPYAQCLTE